MAWREKSTNKSQFILLSSKCEAKSVNYSIRRSGTVVQRKNLKLYINTTMAWVASTVHTRCFTLTLTNGALKNIGRKWFLNIFGRMVLNSYVLYKLNSDNPMSRVKYYISVIES